MPALTASHEESAAWSDVDGTGPRGRLLCAPGAFRWRQAGRQGVLFLGLDMQDVTDDAREFLREFRISYPNVREGGKETSRRYGGTGLPETYLISARGQVVGHVIGALTPAQLRGGVAAARDGRPAATRLGRTPQLLKTP